MWNGSPRAAAAIASVIEAVTPRSRPTPYTNAGRSPMLGKPSSAQNAAAVPSFARFQVPYNVPSASAAIELA